MLAHDERERKPEMYPLNSSRAVEDNYSPRFESKVAFTDVCLYPFSYPPPLSLLDESDDIAEVGVNLSLTHGMIRLI